MSSAGPREPTEAVGQAPAKPLGIAETIEVLTRLGAAAQDVVLIGGQALNFWARQYVGRVPGLWEQGPFASKDIDFCGTQEQLRLCARALGGREVYQASDARSLCVGVVHYYDSHDEERQLDFLSKPFGLEAEPVSDMGYLADLTSKDGRQVTLKIMHPFHCFMSRVANVGGLEKYQTEHGVRQLKASLICLRTFLELELEEGQDKTVNKLNERIFKFSLGDYAQRVFELYGIEPFSAALHGHDRLPPKFNAVRYPQMQAQIAKRRGTTQ